MVEYVGEEVVTSDGSLRVRITENFEWGGIFENWSKKFVSKNARRIEFQIGGFDDALQECALIFLKCKVKYARTPGDKRQFMAYFKTSVINRFHTLSTKDFNNREILDRNIQVETQDTIVSSTPVHAWAYLVERADDEMAAFLDSYTNAAESAIDLIHGSCNVALTNDVAALQRCMKRFFGLREDRNFFSDMRSILDTRMTAY